MKKMIMLLSLVCSLNLMAQEEGAALKIESSGDVSISGDLKKLRQELNLLDSGNVEFHYQVVQDEEHFDEVKKVAKYIAAILFENMSTQEPQFCGEKLEGEIFEKSLGRNKYLIAGSGDGGSNSCTGHSYPGVWEFRLEVSFDPKTKRGTAQVHFYGE